MSKLLLKKSQSKNPTSKKKALFKKTQSTEVVETVEQRKPLFETLDEVVDKTRDISFFYSGVEYEQYLDGCYEMGIRNFLMSYHYLSNRNLRDIFDKYPDIHLFVDSGAFTYISDGKYDAYDIAHWESHIQKYLRWAERNKEHIFAIANLDIEARVGAETVDKWNKEYFEPFMLQTGIPVCFVHHEGLSLNSWEYYCKRYPYAGFSSVNINGEPLSMGDYRSLLRTAEKYDTLVHGFGMTRIKELSELPYYTVDSTTWKVGMRYGKLIIFDGSTVKQIDQSDWDSKAIPRIQNYPIDIDIDKLWEYDEPEVIRANVYAFMLAEEHVKNSIKHLQYWKRAKAVQNDVNNIPDGFLPSLEWLNSNDKSPDDVKEYAKKLNINPDMDSINDVALAVIDMTSFIMWDNPEYEERHEAYIGDEMALLVLHELHDKYINRIVPDDEQRVKDLINFYTLCFEGKKDTLLQEGTNFDRIVKERDDYVDDTEYDLVDVSKEDVISSLGSLLPQEEGAPEVDELDDEIFGQVGLVPVRDEKGRLLKGQKKVLKPKEVYSKKFPKFACDTCNAAAKCPEYRAGFVCAYHKLFKGFDTRDMGAVINAMQGMANHNLTRMQRAMVMEVINGTVDADVTALIDQNMRIMENLRRMYESQSTPVLKQTRTMQPNGVTTETLSVSNPQSGGILEKLFSKALKNEPDEPAVEVSYKEVENTE